MNSRKTWIWALVICGLALWMVHLGLGKGIAKAGANITWLGNWIDNGWKTVVSYVAPKSDKLEMEVSIAG